jgi:nitrite reductase/ring-hydroxylating ferredoxin subunit
VSSDPAAGAQIGLGQSHKVALCEVSYVPAGQMRRVCVPGFEAIAVYNIGGSFYATSDTCTHAAASLTDGELEEDRVICPAHSAEFDVRTGRALCFPATKPIATYPTTIEAGAIIACLPLATFVEEKP